MALTGAICLSAHMPQRKRLTQGYAMVSRPSFRTSAEKLTTTPWAMLQHARLAYGKCNSFGLVRYVDKRFPEVSATVTAEVLRANAPSNLPTDHSPPPPFATFPTISGGGFRREPHSESEVLVVSSSASSRWKRPLLIDALAIVSFSLLKNLQTCSLKKSFRY
jgi:hypothetical protein